MIEVEHIFERSWFAITESCLAFTVFRDEFSTSFVISFICLLFFKAFVWILSDRVDSMERNPRITNVFHIRVVSLLLLLTVVDAYSVHCAMHDVNRRGASVQLVFAFEYAVLYADLFMIAAKYTLHSLDMRQRWLVGWDRKQLYILYAELASSFFRLILYIGFFSLMLAMKVFALFAIRPTYMAVRTFTRCLNDVIRSRIAIRNLNTLFPDATLQDLQNLTDSKCIICHEDMITNESDSPELRQVSKKLHCGHIFHIGCLQSWFQRQQRCPICRDDVVNSTRRMRTNNNNNNNNNNNQNDNNNQNNNNINRNNGRGGQNQIQLGNFQAFTFTPFVIPPPPMPVSFPQQQQQMPNQQPTSPQSLEDLRRRERQLLAEVESKMRCLESVQECLGSSVSQLRSFVELVNQQQHQRSSTS